MDDSPALSKGPRVYSIDVTDVATGNRVFHLQWLIDVFTLQFLIADFCYQLAVPFLADDLNVEGNKKPDPRW
jgi:hypothetical protein